MSANTKSESRTGGWMASCKLTRDAQWAALLSTDQPGVRPLTPAKRVAIEQALDGLAEIFGGECEWMLTGGLAIAATMGRFYRDANDLDIAVDQDQLARLVEVAQKRGYEFFVRRGALKVFPKTRLTFYQRIAPAQASSNWWRRFRLIRTGRNGWRASSISMLDFIDVYAYECRDGLVRSNGSDMRVSVTENCGAVYTSISGRKVLLRGMGYMAHIKRLQGGEKDRFDLEMMRQHGLPC